MIASTTFAVLLSAITLSVNAEVTPSEPGPGTVFRQGQTCRTVWFGDAEEKYGKMSIQLMTGDNWNMVHLDTVGADLDGNKDGKLEFPCPEVEPYSAVYFFQYSAAGSPNTWATRFTIADKDGNTVTPPETTQPNGDKIPWGIGKLVDSSKAKPPPSYLGTSSESGGSGSNAGSNTSSSSVQTSSPSSPTGASGAGSGSGSNTGAGSGSNTGAGSGSNTGAGSGSNTGAGSGSGPGTGTAAGQGSSNSAPKSNSGNAATPTKNAGSNATSSANKTDENGAVAESLGRSWQVVSAAALFSMLLFV